MLRKLGVYTIAAGCLAALLAVASVSHATQWATIGAPGNRPTTEEEAPGLSMAEGRIGAVDYRYRLTRTEVTAGELVGFLNAYAPYMSDADDSVADNGAILFDGYGPGRVPRFRLIDEDLAGVPGQTTWNLWARYVNWRHNDRALTEDAFESGVYDTSKFGADDANIRRADDARFWIPSRDEWVKGMYYDPDRYGPGQEGYWLYPHGSDEAPVPGLPGEGGETNAGDVLDLGPPFGVGSYPGAQSPWGLLDGSGGVAEWAEDFLFVGEFRTALGSGYGELGWEFFDRLDSSQAGIQATNGSFGLRLASAVPGPGGAVVAVLGTLCAMQRRRR